MKRTSYVLVVNLKSRQAASVLDEVKKAFKENKAQLEVLAVKDPKKMNQVLQKAMKMKSKTVVLGGGDGTLISGMEYLSSHGYKGEVGVLPLGTANYLVRNLSIPLDIPGSVRQLIHGKSKNLPLGVANDRLFSLTFILGITQAVSENVSDKRKKKLGQFAYVLELFKQTTSHEPFKYTIESPSLKKPLKGSTHQIVVYNSDINQQLKLVPDHSLRKHSLKVVISRCGKSKTKLYFGFLVHILTVGKIRPYMYVFETQELTITTVPNIKSDYDGETYGKGPFKISLYDKDVAVIS